MSTTQKNETCSGGSEDERSDKQQLVQCVRHVCKPSNEDELNCILMLHLTALGKYMHV